MVYNRYYILELTGGQLNTKWSVNFNTPDAQNAPIVLIAKNVLPKEQLACAIESLISSIRNGEGSYSAPGISLTVHADVQDSVLQGRLTELAKDVRSGHGF